MNTSISDDNELITKINVILVDFGTFDKASINDDGSMTGMNASHSDMGSIKENIQTKINR